jgi:hypothetical protein
MAGGADLLLVLDEEPATDSYVVGRILDAGARIDDQEIVSIWLVGGFGQGASGELEEGCFRLGPVQPGTYLLRVIAGDRVVLTSEPFEVLEGREHDLGELRTQSSGSLRVSFSIPAGVDVPAERVNLVALDHERQDGRNLVLEDGFFLGRDLSPGTYSIRSFDHQLTNHQVLATVRSGEETRVHVDLEPGAVRALRVELPEDAGPWSLMEVVVRDQVGAAIFEQRVHGTGFAASFPFANTFPLGTSEITFRTDTGLSAHARVCVDSIDGDPGGPTVIQLR